MKWIEIDKSKKLKFNEPVFIQYTNGKGDPVFGQGKLLEEKSTGTGTIKTFAVAQFEGDDPVHVVTVTHVAVP